MVRPRPLLERSGLSPRRLEGGLARWALGWSRVHTRLVQAARRQIGQLNRGCLPGLDRRCLWRRDVTVCSL